LDGALESPVTQDDNWHKVVEGVANAITPAVSSIPCSGNSENSDIKHKTNLATMHPLYSGTPTR
jgi:hypothetical protein